MQDRISQKNIFTGGIDTDTALTGLNENDYIRATNVRTAINESQQFQILTNVKGNLLTSYSLPAGYNKEIGSYEDKYTNTLFYMVYNSNGEHSILRYYPATNTIEKVAQDSIFDWRVDTKITHIDFVDKKLLYWVDPKPRKINSDRATDNKPREYHLVQTVFNPQIPNPPVFNTLTLFNSDGTVAAGVNINGLDYEEVADNINALTNLFNAEVCGNEYVKITIGNAQTATYVNNSTNSSIAIPANFYPAYTERNIYRGVYPHPCPPTISPVNDPDKGYNLIKEKHFQFMVRIVYADNEKSVYSPISDISLADCATHNYNGIRIDFTEDSYSDISTLAIIQRVEIVAREGNLGKFKRIKTFEREELWDESGVLTTQYHDFFNDGNYETIDDSSALRPWDVVGREIQCQSFADDRLFDAHILENYDKPCPDVTFEAEFTELSKLRRFNVSGLVKIWSDDFYGVGSGAKDGFIYNLGADDDGNPTSAVWGGSNSNEVRDNTASFGQKFALEQGGFVIYDATNSNFFTLSKQNTSHGLPVTSTGALSAGTQTEKDAITAYIQAPGNVNQKFFSEWTLRGLPPGVHVIRVASHWCSFGDKLDKGSLYDLNGSGFHKTSMPIKTFTNQGGADLGTFIYEVRIEIDPNGDYRIFSSANPSVPHNSGTADANNNIFMGEIIVHDNINVRDDSDKRWCVDGYVIDANGSSDHDQLAENGIFMERQLVTKEEFFVDAKPLPLPDQEGRERLASIITDHNGYFFFPLDGANTDGLGQGLSKQALGFRVDGTNNMVIANLGLVPLSLATLNSFKISNTGTGNNAGQDSSILSDLYNGNIKDSTMSSATTSSPFPLVGLTLDVNSPAASYFQVLFYNTNPDVSTQNRVRIKGAVQENGVGISGLSVLYERNGRQEFTGNDGSFELIAYDDYEFPIPVRTRIVDHLIVNNPNDCELDFSGSLFYKNLLQIVSFGQPQSGVLYGDSERDPIYSDYDLGTITATLIGNFGNRYLKSGGTYQFALLYVDEMFRRCDLVIPDNIYVPFVTESRNKIQGVTNAAALGSSASDGFFTFTMNIGGTAPSWAKHVWVLRTLNATYNRYIQFPAFDVKYVVDFDGTQIQETTFETSTANELWINVTESLAKYQLRHTDSLLAYTFTEGDRIRFISDHLGNLVTNNGQPAILDMKIKGERSIDDSTYVVVDLLDSLPKMEGGMVVELYSPKLEIEKEAFYEIHTCIEITNGSYAQPSIPLDTGDTYRRTRIAPIQSGAAVNYIEDESISDFYVSDFQDIGKVSFSNPDFKEIERTNAIRFSGKFFEDTKINNLSTFELLNVEQTPKVMGAMNALILTNDDNYRAVLLCIHENNTASAYIGDAIYSDVAGADVIALSSKVLPALRILKGDFGTLNPESVSVRDGMVWWWDEVRGRFIRYALNGLTPISDVGFKAGSLEFKGGQKYMEGVYDVYYDEYICTKIPYQQGQVINYSFLLTPEIMITVDDPDSLTIGQAVTINGVDASVVSKDGDNVLFLYPSMDIVPPPLTDVEITYNKETVAWSETKKRWTTFYSFAAEGYGTIDDKLISFKNGELWVHDTNPIRNNFYGVQYNSDVTLVFNMQPFMIKMWFNIRVQANSKWSSPNTGDVSLLDNASYPVGMESRIKADNFELVEGQFWAKFLRNMNDPRFATQLEALLQGEMLRGEVLSIRLQNDSTSLATLRMVEAFSYQSMLTEA